MSELADGELGMVSVSGLAVELHLEPSNRVLIVTVGAGVSNSRLHQLLRMPQRSNGPIATLEAEVDTSG